MTIFPTERIHPYKYYCLN